MDQFNTELNKQLSMRGVQYNVDEAFKHLEAIFEDRHGKSVPEAIIEFVMKHTKIADRGVQYMGDNVASRIMARIATNNEPVDKKHTFLVTGLTDNKKYFINMYHVDSVFALAEYVEIMRQEREEQGTEYPAYLCTLEDITKRLYS